MSAPLPAKAEEPASARLYGYTFFHLNLCFSSIEEEQRAQVIARCYWPMLALASEHGIPLGIEASGYTLEEIEKRDPAWIAQMRHLIGLGLVEFIGSGYAQLIGPLVPARVTQANLLHGAQVYQRLIGTQPTLALINEQAYSAGLIPLYREAGYRAVLMDWDN
ncbi:MAG: hypothetical protein HXY22_06355 [Alphaproteobacteria bacterium]|nr:hypothetical protein [Alphaproteobacteria bacterium]